MLEGGSEILGVVPAKPKPEMAHFQPSESKKGATKKQKMRIRGAHHRDILRTWPASVVSMISICRNSSLTGTQFRETELGASLGRRHLPAKEMASRRS